MSDQTFHEGRCSPQRAGNTSLKWSKRIVVLLVRTVVGVRLLAVVLRCVVTRTRVGLLVVAIGVVLAAVVVVGSTPLFSVRLVGVDCADSQQT